MTNTTPNDIGTAEARPGSVQRFVGRHSWALLINANCLDVRDEMAAVQVVITDPPYGTGKYALDEDSTVQECLLPWARKAVFGYPETLCGWCATLGKPDEWVTWYPTNKIVNYKRGLRRETEAIAIWGELYERPKRPRSMISDFGRKMSIQRGKDPDWCEDGDLWRDKSPGTGCNGHIRTHPNEKPESLMCKLVKLCSVTGETICDPYMGSGTTGVAAVRLGRNFIGIERDAAHYKTACDRIAHELHGALL
jgi:site-specific DNA-methyltransferase (adenine-specific)